MAASTKNKKLLKLFNWWLPILIIAAVIFYFSSLSGKCMPGLFPHQDIVFHFIIYTLLAYFFARALEKSTVNISQVRLIIFTLFFGIIYGALDELHQYFVPGRCMSGFDLFVDGAGTLFGSLLYK